MRQPIIAVTSIASILGGLAVMGLVVSIQQDPLAWTKANRSHADAGQPRAVAPEAPTAPLEPAPSPEPGMEVVELPVVSITASRRATLPSAPASAEALRPPLEPCSEWRDLGPAYVDEGVPLGTRRVRQLC